MNINPLHRHLFRLFYWFLSVGLLVSLFGRAPAARARGDSVPERNSLVATFDCTSQAQIPMAECEALVAFYHSTNGAGWRNNTGWLQTDTPCSWFGVICDSGNHVTRLWFIENNLSGSIPPELENLAELTILFLIRNKLTGTIPFELSNLANLEQLDLRDNQLTGSIPSQLGNLTNLFSLMLNNNQLTGAIPAELGNLTNLTFLELCPNRLTSSIPAELGNLKNLGWLHLCGNQLTGSIPTELGNLTKLIQLDLSANQLTGSIPSQLGNLTALTELSLSYNQLIGSIPPQLGNLAHLSTLNLYHNQLTGPIPLELGKLSGLSWLYLDFNQLRGTIPAQLRNLTSLIWLGLSSNQLTGSIPPELGDLTQLYGLSLDHNLLTDSIPRELGDLTHLSSLSLDHNQLTGSIPMELGNLRELTELTLDGNRLSGEFPTTITQLTYLDWRFTFDCWITSTVPEVIAFLNNKAPGWQGRICPAVSSIAPASLNPTRLSSVNFMVTFSEPVAGVTLDDFRLTVNGITAASITGLSGSGQTRTVTVDTGSGNGTLRLDVADDNTIANEIGNALGGTAIGDGDFTWGEFYVVAKAPTFGDVSETHWAWSFVELLYGAAITSGCSLDSLLYCPEETVSRAQMAVFLERAIHGSAYTPPDVGAGIGFGDVTIDYWSGAWIKQLAAEGITTGCGNGNYCPEDAVTRAQMAVFLLRAKHGASYVPPDAGSDTGFGDVVTDYWAAAFIKQLVAEGITVGCGNGNYCPEAPVTRAEMAVFLVRTFNLP